MKAHRLFLACGLLAAAFAAPTRVDAQEIPGGGNGGDDGSCNSAGSISPGIDGGNINAVDCGKQNSNETTLIQVSESVRQVIAGRLLGDVICSGSVGIAGSQKQNCIQPAGLRFGSAKMAADQLAGDGTFTIAPTADVTTATPARKWNSWIDGKFSWSESGLDDNSPTDGPQVNLTGGVDYKITDKIIFGLVGTFESSDLKTKGVTQADTDTDGWGGGAYVGVTLTDHLVYSGMITLANIDTDFDAIASKASLNSDRLSISNGLTGYWYFGQTRMSPSVNVAYSEEWQDSYTDSTGAFGAKQTFQTGVTSFGNLVGHTFSLSDTSSIEPWAGFQFDWTFINSVGTKGSSTLKQNDTLDLRLQTGLNWNLAENMQLALTGEIGGLLLSDTNTYSGEINFAYQF